MEFFGLHITEGLNQTTPEHLPEYHFHCLHCCGYFQKGEWQALEKWLIIVGMVLMARSVIKLSVMWDHGCRGIGQGSSSPLGSWCEVRKCAQTEQALTYCSTSCFRVFHQNFISNNLWVCWIPGCPEFL